LFAVVAFEELEKKYPEIMNSMTFAQLAAESRKKRALAENTSLPSPPKVPAHVCEHYDL
jgi:hypothetical protein